MPGSILNPVVDAYHYDPDKHIPDLSSKVIILTGANAGLGLASAIEFAKHNPRRLYLTTRTRAKYDSARASVLAEAPNANVEYLELDLASFTSIKVAADRFLSENDRLDILMNNAGIMGAPAGTTVEGYEIHFGTNHMGPALFTKLLLPLMLKTAEQPDSDVRIVDVSSMAHNMAPGSGFQVEDTKGPGTRHSFRFYGHSKLANVLHARELARRYPSILSTSLHPGRVETSLLTDMFAKGGLTSFLQQSFDRIAGTLTPREGAMNQLWCATWKRGDITNGEHYVPWGKVGGDKRGKNPELAKKLWEYTEEELQKHGY